jgi:lysophospholipase L1-like esterase
MCLLFAFPKRFHFLIEQFKTFAITSIAIALSVSAISLQKILRIYVYCTKGELALISDDSTGWAVKPNFKFQGNISSYNNQKTYPVTITTNKFGFRKWANLDSNRKKVLILGDSMTHSMYVSDDKTWYSILGQSNGLEIFTYGCSGYGTLQEYQFLDRYYDIIKPDLVLLAFVSNDFANNYDSGSYDPIENAYGRPYLKDGKYVLRRGMWGNIKRFIAEHSYLGYFVLTRGNNIACKYNTPLKESDAYNPHDVTVELLKRIKGRCGSKTALMIFPLSCEGEAYEKIRKISDDLGIKIVAPNVNDLINKADSGKNLMRAADGSHLNEDGEKIAGDCISQALGNF